jgi:putative nonproteinogenic amino acid hydroxylase
MTPSTVSSHRVGRLTGLSEHLKADLSLLAALPFESHYSDFVYGKWTAFVLANESGDERDGLFSTDCGTARLTELGRRVPAVMELVERNFDTTRLQWVRVFAMQAGMLMSHRDFVEFGTSKLRLNVPLQTDLTSLHSEESQVFHMPAGEIWFLDATRTHAAATLSDAIRLNICLDFDLPDTDPAAPLLPHARQFGPPALLARPPVPDAMLTDLRRRVMAAADLQTVRELLWEAAHWQFSYAVSADDHFEWVAQALEAGPQAAKASVVRDFRRYCIERRHKGESFAWAAGGQPERTADAARQVASKRPA